MTAGVAHVPGYIGGWYQVAFARSVGPGLSPAAVGARRLVLVADGAVRAFNAACPHRGAHLAVGGRLHEGRVVCPFHGYAVGLGDCGERLAVREYPVLVAGGMVFVRLTDGHDNGWTEQARALERDYWCVNGFEMAVRAPMALVIENAFDRLHFRAVHGIRTEAFEVSRDAAGALAVHSAFHLPRRRTAAAPQPPRTEPAVYRGLAISPGLAVTDLLGELPYRVVTGATDQPDGGCVVRITVAFPRSAFAEPPPPAVTGPLVQAFRRGLEQDRAMWENLSDAHDPCWMPDDACVHEFQRFCSAFRA